MNDHILLTNINLGSFTPPARKKEHFTVPFQSAELPHGNKIHVGRFNAFIPHLHEHWGLKIVKNLYSQHPSKEILQEIIKIHEIFFEHGIGPRIQPNIIRIDLEKTPETSRLLPYLHWDCTTCFSSFYGFFLETLTPENAFCNIFGTTFDFAKKAGVKMPFIGKYSFQALEDSLNKIISEHNITHRNSISNAVREFMDNAIFDAKHQKWMIYDIDKNNAIVPS